MKLSSSGKIGLIIIVIILLPLLFFTAYEINSLNEDEEILNTIFNQQLETIIFSVNQYSSDVVNSWANEIEEILLYEREPLRNKEERFVEIFGLNKSIKNIILADSAINILRKYGANDNPDHHKADVIQSALRGQERLINRLINYAKNSFRKIEAIDSENYGYTRLLLFALRDNHTPGIIILEIDVREFIRQNLAPKLQEFSKDEIILSCTNSITQEVIYSTENIEGLTNQQSKPLWIIPDFMLSIYLKGSNIEEIVKARSTQDIILLLILTFLILSGTVMIFRNLRRELKFAQLKSDFVSNVSHELRTPLALISMFAETLELGRVKSEEKRAQYYSIISSESQRLSRIVNTILNFSKMEAGKREFKFETIDLNDVAKKIVDNYAFHLKNKSFSLITSFDDQKLMCDADAEAIEETIINLIDNAVKYSKDKKEIEITTGADESKVFCFVKDQGIGITQEDQEKVFDKFFRASKGLVHDVKGTGMGLSIVSQIVKAHGGEIKLESSPGKGSKFTIFLPKID